MFFKGSRYEKVPVESITDATGRIIRYTATRFIPDRPAVAGHLVMGDERLDHIAWVHYRDAERFWLICDGNRAQWPPDLLEEGAIIDIPASGG